MNADSTGWKWAWIPLPLFVVGIVVLWSAGSHTVCESPVLLVLLNVVFSTFVSFFIAALCARSFLTKAEPGVLLLGCGMLVWGGACTVAALEIWHGGNDTVTIHNTGVWISGLCSLVGVLLSLRVRRPLRFPKLWLAAVYPAGLIGVAWISVAAYHRWLPVFFIQGQGGTPVRQAVLGTAIVMFLVTAGLMWRLHRRNPSGFLFWYAMGLALLATGLMGVLIQTVHGSLLGWVGRAAQYLGGLYLLVAVLISRWHSGQWRIPLKPASWDHRVDRWNDGLMKFLSPVYLERLTPAWRYGFALCIVAVVTILRRALIPWMGIVVPYNLSFVAIISTTLLLGVRAGLLSVVLAIAAVEMFVLRSFTGTIEVTTFSRISTTLAIGVFCVLVLHSVRIARRKVNASEERLAAFALATFEGIVESENGHIVDCNEQFARMIGRTAEELRGVFIADLMMPEDWARAMPAINANRESVIEHTLTKTDGTTLFIEAHGRPVAPGSRRRYTAVRDITARRQAEFLLRNSEEAKFSALFHGSSDGILLLDPETWQLGMSNDSICRMLGYTAGELRTLHVADIHPASEMFRVNSLFEKILKHEINSVPDIPMRRKDGSVFHASITIASMTISGRQHLAGFIRDITHERFLEEQVRQAQKLEAVGRLAGGVAHDFNNILQAVFGFCDILLANTPEPDDRRRDILEIHKAAGRAAGLTRQLLAFSRRQLITPTVLDLNAVVNNTGVMLKRLIGEDVEMVTCLAPDLRRIRADAGNMEQVIMNLTLNARDAMPQGGRVTLTTANVTLDDESVEGIPDARPGPFVCLTVTDTGCGISKDNLQHIFEPFFSTKGPDKGTGLGLSVIYGIARQHEGWVNVYSEEGRGASFKVYLPAYQDAPLSLLNVPVNGDMPLPGGSGERILLLEDDPVVCRLIQGILTTRGYRVYSAATVAQARAQYEQERGRFDLLFSDVVLPDGNGFEIVRELRARDAGLAVILSSGYTDERARWGDSEALGCHFVQKPYVTGDLLRIVRLALDERSAVRGQSG